MLQRVRWMMHRTAATVLLTTVGCMLQRLVQRWRLLLMLMGRHARGWWCGCITRRFRANGRRDGIATVSWSFRCIDLQCWWIFHERCQDAAGSTATTNRRMLLVVMVRMMVMRRKIAMGQLMQMRLLLLLLLVLLLLVLLVVLLLMLMMMMGTTAVQWWFANIRHTVTTADDAPLAVGERIVEQRVNVRGRWRRCRHLCMELLLLLLLSNRLQLAMQLATDSRRGNGATGARLLVKQRRWCGNSTVAADRSGG